MSRADAAIVVVGVAVHVVLGLLVHAHPLPLGVDRTAFDVLHPLVSQAGVDVVARLTNVGSFPAACVAALLGALAAVQRKRPRDAIALVAGLALLLLVVGISKHLWDRQRPQEMLTGARGLSYPSGHATYATTWVAAAVVAGRRPLVWVAVAVVVAVMVSRLYLHVHFLTDVLGGAALGAAAYAAVYAAARK